jgi:transposase
MANQWRYIGLDVHKQHITVAAVDANQQVILKPRKIPVSRFGEWAENHFLKTDKVALEATTNAWNLVDMLQDLVGEVKVANTLKIRLIADSRSKTDKHDALVLAKLLAARMLPEVWIPPHHVRELRSLVAHRHRLVKARRAAKSRLHSILLRHNIPAPRGGLTTEANQTWWQELEVPASDRLRIRHELHHCEHLATLIAETESTIADLSVSAPWADQTAYLIQLPGIALNSAMVILSAIGDITRFPSASHLVGYAGLGASVYATGQTYRTGKITKQGRKELRTILVECAWITIRMSAYWKTQYQQYAQRMPANQAITIIARKLLVAIWHVLSKREVDRHADPQYIARSFLTWSQQHGLAARKGILQRDFVRRELQRLGLQNEVKQFNRGKRIYKLAT